MTLDLPTAWAFLLALAVFLYVALDGFDLGVGILFPFARGARERDQMVAAIAPVWDGNETWLVLGGGGLLAAFPLAYSVIMPAFYLPVGVMLTALIFRGVAFEFRHHGRGRGKKFWTAAFFGGSLTAALAQGAILGGFIQGVEVADGAFAGGQFDWASPFTLLVMASLAIGYALLGATWLVFKLEGPLLARARLWSRRLAVAAAGAMACVSVATLAVDPIVTARWGVSLNRVDWGQFLRVAPLPLAAAACAVAIVVRAPTARGPLPYALAVGLFAAGYGGLAVSLWPYIVPFALTPHQAAAADNALALLLAGAVVLLPLILSYTAYSYWLFRAKVNPDGADH